MNNFTSNSLFTVAFFFAFLNSMMAITIDTINFENGLGVDDITCTLIQPTLASSNGCCTVSGDPTSAYGQVEWMWAKNVNGDVTPMTGWSVNQQTSYCPSNSGTYRICSRVVGCSTVHESNDIYCDAGPCGILDGVYIYDQSTDTAAYGPIVDGEQINIDLLPAEYYLATEVSGNVESVTFWVDGNSVTENLVPYTFPGGAHDGTNWTGSIGVHNLDVNAYKADDANGEHCDQIWLTFEIVSGCQNVTNSGSIIGPSTACVGQSIFLENVELPSGGSGSLEYVWLFNPNSATPNNATSISSNSSELSTTVQESGYYRRCSRREGCTDYDGESNWVYISVGPCCELTVNAGEDQTICNGDNATLTASVQNETICDGCVLTQDNLIAHFDMNSCSSSSSNGTNLDYSELTATTTNLSCTSISASTMYRNEGVHSCTQSYNDNPGDAMCVDMSGINSFSDNHDKALRFDLELTNAAAGQLTGLTKLEFRILAPTTYWWNSGSNTSGNTGTNNYPTKYGFRILKNGEEIYQEQDLETPQEWELVTVNFDGNEDFQNENTATYSFEFLGYDAVGNNGNVSVLDFDEIKVYGDCCTSNSSAETTFVWSDGQTGASISVDQPGIYGVTATDCFGCEATDEVEITFINENPEVISSPANVTFNCDDFVPNEEPEFSDVCDSDLVVTLEESLLDLDCGYEITKTWTATNVFGSSVSATQVITILDNEVPTGLPLADLTLNCEDSLPIDEPLFSDNCDDSLTVVFEETLIDLPCGHEYVRTWIATDNCGNQSDAIVQTITIVDTIAPEFVSIPDDLVIFYIADLPAPADVQATDNCGMVMINFLQTMNGSDCEGHISRTWTVSDECGNTIEHTQTITITDNEAPVATYVPANLDILCEELPVDDALFSDNCDENLDIVFDQSIVQNGNVSIITNTWTAIDDNGNTTTVFQTINVTAQDAPILIDVPADVTVECSDIPEAPVVTASHDCEDLVVVLVEVITNGCEYTITRTWTATDSFGNSVSETQVITVQDTTAPILSEEPANLMIECLEDLPTAPSITAIDNCSEVEVIFEEDLTTNKCGDGVRRTWTATDDCGNTTSYLQSIFVNDTTAPQFVNLPENLEVLCGNIPTAPEMTATDNCSEDIEIIYSQFGYNGTDCSGTLSRIWTAIDFCGNSVSHTQVITIFDDIAPQASNEPEDAIVGCGEPIPAEEPSFTDNCDNDLQITLDETQDASGDDTFITRNWTATDACGNSTLVSQMITVLGSEALSLLGVPADETVECTEIPAPAEVTASNGSVVSFVEMIDGECPIIITRFWSATNACGNTASATQIILVQDVTAPAFTNLPSDITALCGNVPTIPAMEAIDNCDGDVEINLSQFGYDGTDCSGILTRIWIATDNCGNATTHTQTVTIFDDIAPAFIGGANDITVECDAIPEPTLITAEDNCGETILEYAQSISDGCPYEITRTWTATDECGNESELTQVITVVDTILPVLEGVPADTTVECSDPLPQVATVTANDVCSGPLPIQFQETIDGNIITRMWYTTDACGNMAQGIQLITIVDTQGPIAISVPQDMTIMCDDIPFEDALFEDNCDPILNIEYSQLIEVSGLTTIITNSWTATDYSGNATTVFQTITVNTPGAPMLIGVPSDITVECTEIPEPATVTAQHECEDVEVTMAEIITGGCNYTITRIYTATDSFGNSSSQSQIITVLDTTAPEFVNLPEDLMALCGNIPALPAMEAIDNCEGDVEINLSQFGYNGTDCSGILTRVWTATDDCGNATSHTQVITIFDDVAPIASNVPQDLTLECGGELPTDEPAFTDNCSDVSITYNLSETMTGDTTVYTRSWTATDDCGNEITVEQLVSISGNSNLELLNVPNDATVECDDIPAPANVIASDGGLVDFQEIISGGIPYTITRIWSSSNECSMTVIATQIITVQDTTPPVLFALPADTMVNCGNLPPLIAPQASDACDNDINITVSQFGYNGTDCSGVLTRVFNATDASGNTTSHTQLITIMDTIAPTFVGSANNMTVECDEIPEPSNISAEDNCGDVLLEFSESISDGCPYEIVRIWTATDLCGNASELLQTITVEDLTAPILLNVPADTSIFCVDNLPAPAIVTADDNCSGFIIAEFSEVINGNTITRIWMATDGCGNVATASQTISIIDGGMPVLIGVPIDMTVECDEIPEPAIVTAEDGCSEVTITFIEEIFSGNPYYIVYTWTATDEAGNTVEASQVITVQDTTAPVLMNIPANISVNCNEIPEIPDVTAEDNCDENVLITLYESTDYSACPYTLTRTWTATDAQGNSSSQSQIIMLIDNETPTLVDFEGAIEVLCDETEEIYITAIDNCDNDVEITIIEDQQFSGACYGTIQRTYLIEDNCGNSITAVQFLFLNDDQDPIFTSTPPEEITIECGDDIPEPAPAFATDNCDSDVEIEVSVHISNDGICPYVITYVYIANDDCGNDAKFVQIINVNPGVIGQDDDSIISVSPNPFDNNTKVAFAIPVDGNVVLSVSNSIGQEMMTIMDGKATSLILNQFEIQTSEWESGIYYLKLYYNNTYISNKMMKIK